MYQDGVTHLLNRVNAKDLREAASAAKAAKVATPVITIVEEAKPAASLAQRVVNQLPPKSEKPSVVQTTFVAPPLLAGRKAVVTNKTAPIKGVKPLPVTKQPTIVPKPVVKTLSSQVALATSAVVPKRGDTIAGITIPASLRPFIPDRLVEKNYDYFSLAQKYEKLYNLPAGTMSLILRNEAPQDRNGRFLPDSRGGYKGMYLGLYQFSPTAFAKDGNPYSWESARQYAAKIGRRISGLSMWRDAEEATHAAAAYAAKNMKEIVKNARTQVVVRPVDLYIAHQQGRMAVSNMLLDGFLTLRGKQSVESIRLFEAYGVDILYKRKSDGTLSRVFKA